MLGVISKSTEQTVTGALQETGALNNNGPPKARAYVHKIRPYNHILGSKVL